MASLVGPRLAPTPVAAGTGGAAGPSQPRPTRHVPGAEAVLNWMAEWGEAWEEIDYTPEEIMGTGDTALVTLLYDGVGKGSGMRIEGRFW